MLGEQHGDAVGFGRHHDPVAPLRVAHRAPRLQPFLRSGSVPGRIGRAGRPCVAVVAVPARVDDLLAEVAEQQAAPAVGGLGVAAHHLDARPHHLPALLGDLARARDGRPDGQVAAVQPTVGTGQYRAGLLQQVQRRGGACRAEPGGVPQLLSA